MENVYVPWSVPVVDKDTHMKCYWVFTPCRVVQLVQLVRLFTHPTLWIIFSITVLFSYIVFECSESVTLQQLMSCTLQWNIYLISVPHLFWAARGCRGHILALWWGSRKYGMWRMRGACVFTVNPSIMHGQSSPWTVKYGWHTVIWRRRQAIYMFP